MGTFSAEKMQISFFSFELSRKFLRPEKFTRELFGVIIIEVRTEDQWYTMLTPMGILRSIASAKNEEMLLRLI